MKWIVLWLVGLASSLLFCGCFQYIWNTYATVIGAPALSFWQAYGLSLLASWGALLMAVPSYSENKRGTALTRSYASILVKSAAVLYLWGMAYVLSFFI